MSISLVEASFPYEWRDKQRGIPVKDLKVLLEIVNICQGQLN